jgi:hypothetical protein
MLRLKASARVPLWNGTIECRLLKLRVQAGSMRGQRGEAPASR